VIAAVLDPYVNGVHVWLQEDSELTGTDKALAEIRLSAGPVNLAKNELS
jgi:hypothetical protein